MLLLLSQPSQSFVWLQCCYLPPIEASISVNFICASLKIDSLHNQLFENLGWGFSSLYMSCLSFLFWSISDWSGDHTELSYQQTHWVLYMCILMNFLKRWSSRNAKSYCQTLPDQNVATHFVTRVSAWAKLVFPHFLKPFSQPKMTKWNKLIRPRQVNWSSCVKLGVFL